MEELKSRKETLITAENPDLPNDGEQKKYIVRHNKENVELTLPELIENAEKGLDYDRIRPSHDFIKELAAKGGESDVSHFIAKMKNGQDGTADSVTCPQLERGDTEIQNEKEGIASEYPEYVKDGKIELPDDVLSLKANGMNTLDACRTADLKRTKELCAKLSDELKAMTANRENIAASIGSLIGGQAPEKEYFTSQEWDRLPRRDKEKFIRSGKIYEFMKKWSGK
ncbi:MAG TPA: hypothetical protein VHO66_05495 [Ruminiclostridium sp.]|nr:hypothetical protein [Ruminiclostridium sp.]